MVNIDKYIKTGHKHKICDDAIITGSDPFPYLIVSDGCSSSKESNIGSNILAKSAEYIIRNNIFNYDLNTNFSEKLGIDIINRAWSIAKVIPINQSALDATLLIAFVLQEKLYFICYGDGNAVFKENKIEVFKTYEQKDNMPDYLSYFLEEDRKQLYLSEINFNEKEYKKETASSMFIKNLNVFNYTVEKYNANDLDYFIISTDGIESFFDGKSFIKVKEIGVNQFKNLQGVFLERRMNKIIKEKEKLGVYHHDDLGIAAFSFENKTMEMKDE